MKPRSASTARATATLALGLLAMSFQGPAAAAVCFQSLPLKEMLITSHYGMRIHPDFKTRELHSGVDFRARTGTPIYAVHPGRLRSVFNATGKRGGNYVEIQGADKVVTQYMHASKQIAENGAMVEAGQLIAEAGWSGLPSPSRAHLHFQTVINGNNKVYPTQFFCGKSFPATDRADPPLPWQNGDPIVAKENVNSGKPAEAPAGSPPGTPGPAKVPAEITGGIAPPTQTFPTMDDMSMREFLGSETSKRFLNPQWYLELIDPAAALRADPKNADKKFESSSVDPKQYMARELMTILSLDNLMASERFTSRENIEARLAAFVSVDAKNYSEKVLLMLRMQQR